jgi:hypothetical protein
MPCSKWLFSEIDAQGIHSGGNIGNENTGKADLKCRRYLPLVRAKLIMSEIILNHLVELFRSNVLYRKVEEHEKSG